MLKKDGKRSYAKHLVLFMYVSIIIFSSIHINAEEITTLNINSSKNQLEKNESFYTIISIDQEEPIIMVQVDLLFDPNIIQCNSVNNGNPAIWGSFFPPTVNNSNGVIHGACVAVMGTIVTNPTNCFNISFTALNADGTTTLALHEILITNATGDQIVAISATEETIIVGNGTDTENDSPYDDNNNSPSNPNEVPIIEEHLAGPVQVFANLSYKYSVTAMDEDNDDIFYQCDWGDNTFQPWKGPYNSGFPCLLIHQWTLAGTYEIKVKLKDTYGHETTWLSFLNVSVEDEADNQTGNQIYPPYINFQYTPTNPKIGEIVIFQDLSQDIGGNITKWFWDFGDGNISHEKNPQHVYSKSGTYKVTLTVWDNMDLINSSQINIMVQNQQESSTNGFELILFALSVIIFIAIIKKVKK